jgi:hypothetical protein
MPRKLATICLAAALVFAGWPAHAAGMPDTGTKNFVPGGDAPSYLTNENLAVAPGSPGQSPIGSAFNEPAQPPRSDAAHRERASRRAGLTRSEKRTRHAGRYSSATRRSSRAGPAGTLRGRRANSYRTTVRTVRGGHKTAPKGRTAAATHGKASTRHAAIKSAAGRG